MRLRPMVRQPSRHNAGMRLPEFILPLVVLACTILGAAATAWGGPPAAPTPEQLEALAAEVQGYVDRDEAVGAELLVLHGGKPVHHSGHGFADRESKQAWRPDRVVCLRSMTKPLVGTAVQILIDEGRLSLDDRVAKWLPAFDHDRHASITVRHLLEHTSGLPLSSLIGTDPRTITSLETIVARASKAELSSQPGAAIDYSDDGTDVLTAIVAKASGMPADEFIARRVLEPLGMQHTYTRLPEDRSEFASAYVGVPQAWSRLWSPSDAPLFGTFLGSQAAYGTASDYARLLAAWQQGGVAGDRRLLSRAAVERGLAVAHALPYPTGLSEARAGYGQLWMLWVAGEGNAATRIAFGHGGSDGTMAWCFPERDLIVVYCTQSRGGMSVLDFEAAMDRILFGHPQATGDPSAVAGWWWDVSASRVLRISECEGKVVLDIPGTARLALKPARDAAASGAWAFDFDPASTIRPERDETRAVVALRVQSQGKNDRWTRFEPGPGLPTADEVAAMVEKAHGIGAGGLPFPLERRGATDIPNLKRHVELWQRFDGLRFRTETHPASGPGATVLSDGTNVWSIPDGQPAQALAGPLAEQAKLEHPGRLFGDWRAHFAEVRVLASTDLDGRHRLHVWCVPAGNGTPLLFHLDRDTGRVVGVDRIVTIPGLGPVGVETTFDDFRPIASDGRTITLPFRSDGQFQNDRLGLASTAIASWDAPPAFGAETFAEPLRAATPPTEPAR